MRGLGLAGVHVEIEGVRLPVHMRGDEAYVGLGAFAAARFLEYEYSHVTSTYLLRNPQDNGRTSILEFRPDESRVLVDGREQKLRSPPVEGKDGLLVPLHDFAALVLGPRRAAAIQIQPDEGDAARLIEMSPLVRNGTTKLLFNWEGQPQVRLERHPERSEVEIVFEGAVLGRNHGETPIGSPEVTTVHLSEDAELLQVRAVVGLTGPTASEGFFLASSHQYVLTLRKDQNLGTETYALPETVSEEERAFLSQQLVGIDPSHGGGELGSLASQERTEKAFVLAFARDLKGLCEPSGLRTELVRDDDRLVPMQTRIHTLNRARCSLVLSLHARSQQAEVATTGPILFLLPQTSEPETAPETATTPAAPGQDLGMAAPSPAPLPDLSSLHHPNPRERSESRILAETLARILEGRLGTQSEILEDPSLLPMARVLTPGLALDLGPLGWFAAPGTPDFERDPVRRRLAFACYQGLLTYFREQMQRSPAPLGAVPPPSVGGLPLESLPLGGMTPPPQPPRSPRGISPEELRGLQRNILDSPEYQMETGGADLGGEP